MAYTVKQVAAMSGVSVRTLHFYDETGLLKPAHLGANGYRFYEEPQLLTLQQILFYRELGFELKQIKQILGRADFEKAAALQSHRKVLQKNLTRTRKLIETIDKTILHLKGTKKMKSKEMFAGFSVAAGDDRFGEQTKLGDQKLALIQEYAHDFLDMTNEKASTLAHRAMELDDQRLALRHKYYNVLAKALPAVLVARFFQLDNQIQLVVDLQIASNLPIIEEAPPK